MMGKEEIEALEKEHAQAPHLRLLQKALAKDLTIRVHSQKDYETAVEASEILFGKSTTESLRKLDTETFLSVFEGVPCSEVESAEFDGNTSLIDLLSDKTGIFASKSEVRRALKENSLSGNKEKATEQTPVNRDMLLNGAYVLVQKGKKNYFLIHVR